MTTSCSERDEHRGAKIRHNDGTWCSRLVHWDDEIRVWFACVPLRMVRRGLAAAWFGQRETTMIRIKRTYEPAARTDGQRILVERLWPRGMKKSAVHADAW